MKQGAGKERMRKGDKRKDGRREKKMKVKL